MLMHVMDCWSTCTHSSLVHLLQTPAWFTTFRLSRAPEALVYGSELDGTLKTAARARKVPEELS